MEYLTSTRTLKHIDYNNAFCMNLKMTDHPRVKKNLTRYLTRSEHASNDFCLIT